MDIERRRSRIRRLLNQTQDEAVLREIELWLNRANKVETDLEQFTSPMAKDVDVDAIAREQGYNGIDQEKFDALVKELDVQEDIDVLLEELKRMG